MPHSYHTHHLLLMTTQVFPPLIGRHCSLRLPRCITLGLVATVTKATLRLNGTLVLLVRLLVRWLLRRRYRLPFTPSAVQLSSSTLLSQLGRTKLHVSLLLLLLCHLRCQGQYLSSWAIIIRLLLQALLLLHLRCRSHFLRA